ncbi:NAD(P)/FAD-dependent oxidoreductase, partial [Staphylococcus aureus]
QHSVESIEKEQGKFHGYARKKEDITRFEADIVIHGAGRGPALDMNLEKGNIERKKHGVHVNEYLQSVSNPNVYA